MNSHSISGRAAAEHPAPIALSLAGAVAVATLDRPPVNAIDEAWLARLDAIVDAVERSGAAVLVLRSAGRAFCAGADLELMRSRFASEDGRARMVAFVQEIQRVYARLERGGFVSIAAIGGAALGGGLELALACDLRVVADEARLGLPEARLGLLPGAGGTQRLTRLCGEAVAKRLILGAEVVGGTEAATLGLAHWAVPAAALDEHVHALAERTAALPTAALVACKQCIAAAADPSRDGYALEVAGTARLLARSETQARVREFLAGRR
ncbi:MAG: enoyl-CoA hydratase/isomerase family protein [Burkholderiales bacterium]|nr:enoyl-CoA hydratase/isomerase family protein [Burkholderiales bacterium]